MFKGLNITCVVYILALYFYNSGGLRVFNHFLRLISFLFCYFLIFLRIFSLVIFLNFFLNFLKKQALVSYKIFLIKKRVYDHYFCMLGVGLVSSWLVLNNNDISLPSILDRIVWSAESECDKRSQ